MHKEYFMYKQSELVKAFREQSKFLKFTDFLDSLPKEEICTREISCSDNTSKTTTMKDSNNNSMSQAEDLSATESMETPSSLMNSTSNENKEEGDQSLNLLMNSSTISKESMDALI